MATTTRSAPLLRLTDLAATPPQTWRLHVLYGSAGDDVASFVLPEGDTVVGRAPAAPGGLLLDDPLLSRQHLRLRVTAGGEAVTLCDLGSRNGTRVSGRRVESARISDGSVIRAGGVVAVLESDFGRHGAAHEPTAGVPGRSAAARTLRGELALASRDAHPALLAGSTGTGKERAAQELHDRSRRRGPLVRFNVTAIPATLFEAELFGHVRGAFSGATGSRAGRFVEADGGTLVLDEIGDLPLALQPKLLRVLEDGLVRPIGGGNDRRVDVRVIASTNRDLDAAIAAGCFRRDLAARLRSHTIALPDLRNRRPDLLELADVVVPLLRGGQQVPWRAALTADAVEAMLLYGWPDNLRGLKATLVRLQGLDDGGAMALTTLPESILRGLRHRAGDEYGDASSEVATNVSTGERPARVVDGPRDRSAPRPELGFVGDQAPALVAHDLPTALLSGARRRPNRKELERILQYCHGNIAAVARHYGIFPRQIYRWLDYAGIDAEQLAAYRQRTD